MIDAREPLERSKINMQNEIGMYQKDTIELENGNSTLRSLLRFGKNREEKIK